jgi:hypothetical protein
VPFRFRPSRSALFTFHGSLSATRMKRVGCIADQRRPNRAVRGRKKRGDHGIWRRASCFVFCVAFMTNTDVELVMQFLQKFRIRFSIFRHILVGLRPTKATSVYR